MHGKGFGCIFLSDNPALVDDLIYIWAITLLFLAQRAEAMSVAPGRATSSRNYRLKIVSIGSGITYVLRTICHTQPKQKARLASVSKQIRFVGKMSPNSSPRTFHPVSEPIDPSANAFHPSAKPCNCTNRELNDELPQGNSLPQSSP